MADWKVRKGAAAWMLVNLAESYRAIKRDDEAHAIHLHAEALPVTGYEKPRSIHRLWLAADAARDGHVDAATALLDKINMESVDRDYKFLRKVIDAMINAGRSKDSADFALVKQTLAAARKIHPAFAKDRELKRIYLQSLDAIASACNGIVPRCWCFWHRLAVR